ncbi:hypothetical protein Q1695_005715 [Nippostrongylus brasiliensis]|nr:hypothetical protein Q1695_005715 [Nippostrongylus brasiliensis]
MEPDSIDKLLNSLRRPTNGKPKSLWNKTLSFVDNLSKKPPPTQMAVGGVTGLCVGYIFTRTSKTAATALGVSLIAFQV